MILHAPFFISSALTPALKLGDATLALVGTAFAEENRDQAAFELVTPAFTYADVQLKSGCGGFRTSVEAFESFLGFLEAAIESFDYAGEDGENTGLFPLHVVQWAADHRDDIAIARNELCDENGNPILHLIED